jgi:polysaccharide biosynthesis transport protein
MLILPLVFIVSCLATGLLVFAVENLDHGFTSLEQIEEILGVGVLGLVPEIKSGFGGRRTPGNYVLDRPQSAYGEAIRSLHTSLMLSDVKHPPKIILVASALPGEGKSSTVLSLARLMASCGKRVAVIDCDLRRPDLHRAFGTAETPGLTDCLLGHADVLQVLRLDTQSPAYLVPAGTHVHTSPDLLGSDAMRALVTTLADRFDLVLLDSAPVLAVSDTRNLCRLADKTVFVVRWQSTRRFAAKPALRQVVDAGGDLAGVLLSMVDLNGYARHSVTGFHQRQLSYYFND